eukprot:372820-Prymnesium_polylepis.1
MHTSRGHDAPYRAQRCSHAADARPPTPACALLVCGVECRVRGGCWCEGVGVHHAAGSTARMVADRGAVRCLPALRWRDTPSV